MTDSATAPCANRRPGRDPRLPHRRHPTRRDRAGDPPGPAGTRGAAVAVARVEPDRAHVLFCGVGDTAAAIVTPTSKTDLPSQPGIVGHHTRAPRTTAHPLPPGSALVMHSDGLTRRWNPETLHGVLRHTPAVIAGHRPCTAGPEPRNGYARLVRCHPRYRRQL
ncbi:SpoIIE family protein phosphatase [Embleya sp. NPDC020630]|uniref:SpoIIE family protein phosphatase n=1 Tax=Embleya sp. NPDC020630 TaxID=3363979 RepID=UPI00379F6388